MVVFPEVCWVRSIAAGTILAHWLVTGETAFFFIITATISRNIVRKLADVGWVLPISKCIINIVNHIT